MKRFLLLVILLATTAFGRAQCLDITDFSAPGVTCVYGTLGGINDGTIHIGVTEDRFAVITTQGTDPYTYHQLPLLPPGESAVVKLGNDLGGRGYESIIYSFVVDSDHTILLLKYARVGRIFDNVRPNCTFSLHLVHLDGTHTILPLCGNTHNFQISGSVIWSPWNTLSFDLSQYVGQRIHIRIYNEDGYHNETFGYTYLTASCISNHLTVVDCDGQNVTLAAPEGYALYQWNNGSTTSTSTYLLQDISDVSCSAFPSYDIWSDCEHTYDFLSIENLNLTTGNTWYDTICQGESYHAHGFQLPAQEEIGTFNFPNVNLNPEDCMSGTLNMLHLTVLSRNVHIYDEACEGADYDNYGFQYTHLQAGSFVDSIPYETGNGCSPAYKYLHLTVSHSLSLSGELFGESYVCDGQLNNYRLNYPETINQYEWDIPDGIMNYSDAYGQSVNLLFTQEAPNPVVISVTGSDGCGPHTLSKTVWHSPSYYLTYKDTSCTGNSYSAYGIQTPLLNETGLYYLSQHYSTVNGCDSDIMVRLWVGATPELTTLAQPTMICEGEETTIHALGENASFYQFHNPNVIKPGDILCSDNTIVKPEDWPCNKIAKGIVFYVDSSGQHGWAVHPNITYYHTTTSINSTNVPVFQTARSALLDINGYLNSFIINNNMQNYLQWDLFDFAGGWYLPAIGQLRILFEERVAVDSSLQLIGGSILFPTGSNWTTTLSKYWSSSSYISSGESHADAWFISSSGDIHHHRIISTSFNDGIPGTPGTRSIINF